MSIMLSPERASVLRRDGRVAFVVDGEPAEWVALDGKAVEAATDRDREHDAFQIDSCWCNGTVIVDAVTVQVLPVRRALDPIDDQDEIVVDRDGRCWFQTAEITLPSIPRPGVDWVVVLTMLSDGSPSARSDNAVQDGE